MPSPDTTLLNSLSALALKAALTGGTEQWGQWGSAKDHVLYVEPISAEQWPARNRRMCRCGCRHKSTHRAAANGVTLSSGCDLSMRRWVKEMNCAR